MPVAALDRETERALEYAGTLAPRVVAVHLRESEDGQGGGLADAWADREPLVPLVVVDYAERDWTGSLLRVMDVLRRTETTERITVVVPAGLGVAGSESGPVRTWAEPLSAAGIAVRITPPSRRGG